MAVPFLTSITLNKNEVQNFKVFNLGTDPGDLTADDKGYFWLNTDVLKLRYWSGTAVRDILDTSSTISGGQISGNISGNAAGLSATLAVGSGGTGLTTYAVGDLLYASATDTLSKLADVATGSALISGGVNTAPSWGKIGLTTHVSGTLPVANGGTGTATGSITGTGALTFTSGGENNNLNLNPKGTGVVVVGGSGYLQANITGTADKAVELSNARTLWGQSFNGTANVTGNLTSVGNITGTGAITVTAGGTDTSITLVPNGTGTVNLSGKRLSNLASPADGLDAVNRNYVDSVVQGLDAKSSCYVATATGGDIILSNPGTISIDGVSYTNFTVDETRILVKDQSDPKENGIYIWHGTASAMTRSPDANTWAELVGAYVFIEKGGATGTTGNAYSGWICSIPPTGTLGTDNVTFVKFSQAGSYTPGRGITQSGTAFNFAQDGAYTAGQIPFPTGASSIGFSSNLFWDNVNKRLGIGTSSPTESVDAIGSIIARQGQIYLYPDTNTSNAYVRSVNAGGTAYIGLDSSTGGLSYAYALNLYHSGAYPIVFSNNGTERLNISSTGVFTWKNVDTVSTAMTLNATGLGIGVASPAYKLDVNGSIQIKANNVLQFLNSDNTNAYQIYNDGASGASVGNLKFTQGGVGVRMTIDSSGNLGLGVTPSAWDAGYKAIQIASGQPTALMGSGNQTELVTNAFYGGAKWKYVGSSVQASRYSQQSGVHYWFSAASGIAGNEITDFASAKMTLDASGNLLVGTTSSSGRFTIGGYSSTNQTPDLAIVRSSSTNVIQKGPNILFNDGTTNNTICLQNSSGSFGVWNYGAGAWNERLIVDASGNLGLGVTPTQAYSLSRAIQIGNGGLIEARTADFTTFSFATNAYLTSAGDWTYRSNNKANLYTMSNGAYTWYTAGASTGTISFTQAMTLDASGNLAVGNSSAASYRLRVYGGNDNSLSIDNDGSRYTTANISNNGSVKGSIYWDNTNTSLSISAPSASSSLLFLTTGSTRLTISSTGAATFSGDVTVNGTGYTKRGTSTFYKIPGIYTEDLTGTGTSFVVNHALGSRSVSVTVRQTASPYAVVYTDVEMTDTNNVTVKFASSVTGSAYNVTVLG